MNILFVCTGNICRSPLAKQVFDQLVAGSSHAQSLETASAGIYALEGLPMEGNAQTAMATLGYVPSEHVSKQIVSEDVVWADLVLTSTELQRSGVVDLHIPANRYTFTLTEFANLCTYLVNPSNVATEFQPRIPTELPSRLEATLKWRGTAPLLANLDINDPFERPQEIFDAMAQQTETAIRQVVEWLG